MEEGKFAAMVLSNLIPFKGFDDEQRDSQCFTYLKSVSKRFLTFGVVYYISHEDIGQRWKRLE